MTVTLGASGGSSVPNWTLLQTATPSGVSTVTFSGLSGYSKYRVMAAGLVAVSGTTAIQINGDSSAHYNSIFTLNTNSPTVGNYLNEGNLNQTSLALDSGSGTSPTFDVQIDNALLATHKAIVGWGLDATAGSIVGTLGSITGIYQSAAVLTSITIVRTANFTSGTIYLLGAN